MGATGLQPPAGVSSSNMVGLTPVGSERSARTRLWPFAHSPPTPPLVRSAAPRTPRKLAMARGRTNGQPGSARKVGVWGDRRESSSMCLAASDGCLDRRVAFEPLPVVALVGGPSARAKFWREGAAWGLHERRLCLASNRQAPRAPDLGRWRERHPNPLTARSSSVG